MAYSASAIVLKSGLFGRLDTLQINKIYTINRCNPYVRVGVAALGGAATVAAMLYLAADSPLVLGVWGVGLVDDSAIYPVKISRRANGALRFASRHYQIRSAWCTQLPLFLLKSSVSRH